MPVTIFRNCNVFDGESAELLESRSVVVEDACIREISSRPPTIRGAHEMDLKGKTLMPGLIDAHVHVNAHRVNLQHNDELPPAIRALHAKAFMEAALHRGFTSLRDAGGADRPIYDAVASGLIRGPRLFFSGRAISQTGGHGDFRGPVQAGCACTYAGSISVIADGADAVRKAAREELRCGSHQVKVMASGGVASPSDSIWMLQYSDQEISAAVEEAQRHATYVMAHAYTPEAITRCLHLGVRSIEHGNLIDAETARLAVEKRAFIVPTLATYFALAEYGREAGFTEASLDKVQQVKEAGLESLSVCEQAGTPMGFGTDLLGSLHRYQCEEFRLRAQVQSPLAILRSATSINARILNQAGKLGVIAEGALADLIVVDGNPLTDLQVFSERGERVLLVMKNGIVCKTLMS